MAVPTILITEKYLKQTTEILQNVEMDALTHIIYKVQDVYIQKLLGTELYLDIQTKYASNSLNSDELRLVAVIAPCLAQYTAFYAIPKNWAKFSNRGIMSNSEPNAPVLKMADMEIYRSDDKTFAEYYAEQVINFLNHPNNVGKFPKYYVNNGREIMPERGTGYICPIDLTDVDTNILKSGFLK